MKARYDEEAHVILVEPDDPEELIPLATDDEKTIEVATPQIIYWTTPHTGSAQWGERIVLPLYGEGLLPQLKRSLGI